MGGRKEGGYWEEGSRKKEERGLSGKEEREGAGEEYIFRKFQC